MALLAEEILEEWPNHLGYFTIRGVRSGVGEIDLLAIRPGDGGIECRHAEVQASSMTSQRDIMRELSRRRREEEDAMLRQYAAEMSAGSRVWRRFGAERRIKRTQLPSRSEL